VTSISIVLYQILSRPNKSAPLGATRSTQNGATTVRGGLSLEPQRSLVDTASTNAHKAEQSLCSLSVEACRVNLCAHVTEVGQSARAALWRNSPQNVGVRDCVTGVSVVLNHRIQRWIARILDNTMYGTQRNQWTFTYNENHSDYTFVDAQTRHRFGVF